MLGWLNDSLEKLILTKYNRNTWHAIKKAARCQVEDGGFVKMNAYEDRISRDLMIAASEELGMDLALFLQTFGAFFMGYVKGQGFGNLLKGQGKTLKELLSNINDMHAHIQSTCPKPMTLPQFWVEDSPKQDGALILHYRSKRSEFLAPLVEGMVTELASTQFQVEVHMNRTQTQGDEGADFTSWTVSAVNPQEQWKLTVAPEKCAEHKAGGGLPLVEQCTKCPFTGMRVAPSRSSQQSLSSFASRRGMSNSNLSSTAAVDHLPSQSASGGQDDSDPWPTDSFGGTDDASEASDISVDSQDYKIGLSGEVTETIFPYHVMINKDFIIGQVGKDLPEILHVSEFNLVGQQLGEVLRLKRPTGMVWDWKCLHMLEDQSFEVEPVLPDGQESALCFKTTIVHVSKTPSLVMLILTPHAQTFQELSDMDLTIGDLPLHGGYRDSVFLSEHLSSQMNNSLKVEKLTRHLAREKDLLESLVPTHAAEGLRKGKVIQPRHHKNVTFFFSDIVGFTTICSKLYPWQVIEMLNNLYCVMDFLAMKFNLFKIETIGDAYVCCSGLPHADPNHARNVANFAVAVSHCVKHVLSPVDGTPIQLRIGVHTGESASGVVGVTNPRYCVFGDTVNTTARHESSGMAGRVHCSSTTRAELVQNYPGRFSLHERGLVEMKGKGKLTTYWLGGSETNKSLSRRALAKLDAEVKDLLVKADFKIDIDTSHQTTQEGGASKGKDVPVEVQPKREFRLPSKTSRVRCSAPSMHDVKRIGSLMRRIKNGEGVPGKNFSWSRKRKPLRATKSLGDEPSARGSKLSDTRFGRLAEGLPQRPAKQPRLRGDPSLGSLDGLAVRFQLGTKQGMTHDTSNASASLKDGSSLGEVAARMRVVSSKFGK